MQSEQISLECDTDSSHCLPFCLRLLYLGNSIVQHTIMKVINYFVYKITSYFINLTTI